jgi:hypothetical protein
LKATAWSLSKNANDRKRQMVVTVTDFRTGLRIATALAALLFSWFAIATILAESFTPKAALFSLDPAATRRRTSV